MTQAAQGQPIEPNPYWHSPRALPRDTKAKYNVHNVCTVYIVCSGCLVDNVSYVHIIVLAHIDSYM